MAGMGVRGRAALLAAIAAGLQACASTPAPVPAAAAPVAAPAAPAPPPPRFTATPGLAPRERELKLLQLLNDGQRDQARAEAVQLLRDAPDDASGKILLDQIDKDPKELLGERNFAYRLQPGDTLSSVAQRFLGDRLLFYALARYNGLDRPGAAEVGQTILVPGVAPKATARPARPRPEGDEAGADVRLKKPPTPAPPPPAPHDPARAAALRGQALAALNRGQADRAVSLLRQAAALDPDSAAVKRDLARAERIQGGVHR